MARARRAARPHVTIVTPYLAASNNGNWRTASRWARFLRSRYRVTVTQHWDGTHTDALIALHARRSAESIAAFAARAPGRALIVALTGTDLYGDLRRDTEARRSLDLAQHLLVLNAEAHRRLNARWRDKTTFIAQSARPLAPRAKPRRLFEIAVVGHLRDEKNPQFVWRLLQALPADLPLRFLHAGRALDPALGRAAAATARRDPRYHWLGDVPHAKARQLIRRAHVLLHPSRVEGGAQVVTEALMAGTPVLGSAIDGNVGLLGAHYPGLFPVDDIDAAARLLISIAREPRAYARLMAASRRLQPRYQPAREQRDLLRVVAGALRHNR